MCSRSNPPDLLLFLLFLNVSLEQIVNLKSSKFPDKGYYVLEQFVL